MYGYERGFLICWKRKRKTIMKKKNRQTHETETEESLIIKGKNPHPSIYLSLATKQKSQS